MILHESGNPGFIPRRIFRIYPDEFLNKLDQPFLVYHFYPWQVEQLWLVHPPQPAEELVMLPLASLELNEKVEMSRFKSFWLQRGQTISSWLLRTR